MSKQTLIDLDQVDVQVETLKAAVLKLTALASLRVKSSILELKPQNKDFSYEIVKAVAAEFKIESGIIFKHIRDVRFTIPRMLCYKLLYEVTCLTLEEIGEILDRDHGTVLYGKRKIEDLMETEPRLLVKVARVLNALNGQFNGQP